MEFINLILNLNAYMSPAVIDVFELNFNLRPFGRFRTEPIKIFDELDRQKKWGSNNTSDVKMLCQERGWQRMVDLIENYERGPKTPPEPTPSTKIFSTQVEVRRVFISYCDTQRDEVEKIKAELEKK